MPAFGSPLSMATHRSMPRRAVPTAAGCTATSWPRTFSASDNTARKNPPPGDGGGWLFLKPNVWRLLLYRREFLFQGVQSHGADNQLGADHIARRAVDAERVGELHILVDRGLDLVAVHVLVDPRHVEAGVFGGGKRVRLVGRAASAQELLVEFDVFLAGRILHARRDRDMRGFDRTFAQDRKFLEHESDVRVGLQERQHVG